MFIGTSALIFTVTAFFFFSNEIKKGFQSHIHFTSLFSLLSSLFSLLSSLFSLLIFSSSSQFCKHLSLFSRFRSLAVLSQSPRSPRPGGSPNSPRNNAYSGKALWPRENHTFEGGSPVFSWEKCTFLSGPFLSFRHVQLFQRKVFILECPSWRHSSIPSGRAHILFHFLHFLSFSFFCFHFLFPFFFLYFFSGARSLFFCLDCLTISYQSSYVKKTFFWAVSRSTPLGPLFFSYLSLFFIFVFFFNFFPCFSFFPLFFPFFNTLFSFFLLKKKVSSFFILFLFFLFSGAQNLWRHSRIPCKKCTF